MLQRRGRRRDHKTDWAAVRAASNICLKAVLTAAAQLLPLWTHERVRAETDWAAVRGEGISVARRYSQRRCSYYHYRWTHHRGSGERRGESAAGLTEVS